MTRVKNKSFAFYLSVYILSIVILIFTFFLIYNYTVSRKLLLKNVEENARHLSNAAVNQIESYFKCIEKTAQSTALFMAKTDTLHYSSHQILKDILSSNPEIYGNCLAFKPYISNGQTIYNAPYCYKNDKQLCYKNLADKSYDYLSWDWYRIPAEENRKIWSEPYYDEGGGNVLMTTFSVPIYKSYADTGSFMGVLTADVSLQWLNELLSNIKIYDSAYAFLISSSGRILSHPQADLIMKENILDLAKETDNTEFQIILQHMMQGKTGFEKVQKAFSEKKSWIYYTSLANNTWSLGFVIPESDLYADLQLLNKDLFYILISGIILLIGFILLIANKLTKPVRKLAAMMHKDSEAFINMPIPEIKESTEIVMLNDSFRYLQKELNRYIAHLKDVTIAKERIESELQIASKLQLSMLPDANKAEIYKNKIHITSYMQAAKEVGGDFYDYFFIDPSHLFFAIGDVSGKGMGAALFMSSTITLLRAYAKIEGNDLCRILQLTSDYLQQNNPENYFVTLFTGILSLETKELTYLNAGHNYPVILSENDEIILINHTHILPLGIIKPPCISPSHITLHTNDALFLYTDGVTEAMNEKQALFGTQSLLALLKNYAHTDKEKLIPDVCQALETFTATAPQQDDITMLCLQLNNSESNKCLHVSFTDIQNISILTDIQHQIEYFLTQKEVPAKSKHRLMLVLEELITNAFKYGFSNIANKTIEINIHVDSTHIEVEYKDNSRAFNTNSAIAKSSSTSPELNTMGKRGFYIIDKMTDTFTYKRENNKNISSFKIIKNL